VKSPYLVDWKKSFYMHLHPTKHYTMLSFDVEMYASEFTPQMFSLSVSAIWDWDMPVAQVRLGRRAALDAHRGYSEAFKGAERFSLEQLVWEGWELPAIWLRCGGIDAPHAWLGGVPVRCVLDEEVDEADLAWVVQSSFPEDYPAYQRVLWANNLKLVDPLSDRLNAILAESKHEKAQTA
jgi:hypothetical protein